MCQRQQKGRKRKSDDDPDRVFRDSDPEPNDAVHEMVLEIFEEEGSIPTLDLQRLCSPIALCNQSEAGEIQIADLEVRLPSRSDARRLQQIAAGYSRSEAGNICQRLMQLGILPDDDS